MSKILLIISIVWLVFSIAHEILTGDFWLWVIPGLAPPIAFVLPPIVLFISTLFLKQNRLAVLFASAVALLVSLPSSGINFGALMPSQAAAEGPAFTVVQMNTDYWGQLRDGTLTDPRDKDRMLAYLRSLNADIYLLQEHMNRVGDLAPPVTDLSDVAAVFPEYRAITAGTLLTLTRLPIVDQSVLSSGNPTRLELPPPPYILKVNVRVGNEVVSAYNIHMPIQIIIEQDWLSTEFYDEIRRRHFIRRDEFQTLSNDVATNAFPLLIAGDFNTSPAMGDNRHLLDITKDAASSSSILYPASWRVGGQLPQLWRTDWFLVRNQLRVDQFRQLDPQGNSDHLASFVNLSVKSNGQHGD